MGEYRLIWKRMTRLFGLFGHAHDEIEMLILKLFPGLASCSRRIDLELVGKTLRVIGDTCPFGVTPALNASKRPEQMSFMKYSAKMLLLAFQVQRNELSAVLLIRSELGQSASNATLVAGRISLSVVAEDRPVLVA
jgi:hypothetical protein